METTKVGGFDPIFLNVLHDLIDFTDEPGQSGHHAPSRAYVRDAKAMAATPADVVEYPNCYQFAIDMPGLKPDLIKVQIEENQQLVVSGERKRESEKNKEGKYVKMERRLGKYLKKFPLPETADAEKVSAVYQDGVLSVTVEKRPPPEPKKAKTIEVQVAG
ncbi:17.1 kDa class II heat shock protein-like [Momordica charantia]|uniref:17.1 kDa class II heat shock protein-like n=1 Tax=Momordica charantia TaxID=3673 RepID=A0A6J1C0H4_MOMCH|nr:17.1 kDa class II heat shock protein-like [Momordica charantia]